MIKPAAPLPWYYRKLIPCVFTGCHQAVCDVTSLGLLSELSGNPEDTELVFIGEEGQRRNIEYIVQACNTFPLLEAYKEYVESKIEINEVPLKYENWVELEKETESPLKILLEYEQQFNQ